MRRAEKQKKGENRVSCPSSPKQRPATAAASCLLASLSVCPCTLPTSRGPSPAPGISSWHRYLVLYFSFFSLFFSFPLLCFESLQMTVLLAGRARLQIGLMIPPPHPGRQVGDTINETVNHSLLCSGKWLSKLTGRAKIWAYPRLPTNTLLYYTLLPAPYPLLALVGLGIYEIFCFAGTENLRILLNWSMSEHTVGTQYPREQA